MIATVPEWFAEVLGRPVPAENETVTINGTEAVMRGGVLRAQGMVSGAQGQTSDTFGFKWAKRDTFEGGVASYMRDWLVARYGDVAEMPWLADAPAQLAGLPRN